MALFSSTFRALMGPCLTGRSLASATSKSWENRPSTFGFAALRFADTRTRRAASRSLRWPCLPLNRQRGYVSNQRIPVLLSASRDHVLSRDDGQRLVRAGGVVSCPGGCRPSKVMSASVSLRLPTTRRSTGGPSLIRVGVTKTFADRPSAGCFNTSMICSCVVISAWAASTFRRLRIAATEFGALPATNRRIRRVRFLDAELGFIARSGGLPLQDQRALRRERLAPGAPTLPASRAYATKPGRRRKRPGAARRRPCDPT